MTYLKVTLFGEFQVRRDGDLIENKEWDRQKTRSLLKLLLSRPCRPFSRDEIIEALWPDTPLNSAERSLWVTVSLLRRALEPDLKRGSDSQYVVQRRPGYLFDRRTDCWVDAWEFEMHREKAEAAKEAGELEEAVQEYRSALALVRGEFLAEEPYEDWAMEAREEWRAHHLAVLSGMAECLAQQGRYSEAIEIGNRAFAIDRYSEESCRRLMLYRYCAGEQALALKAYRDHAKLLKVDLGVDPSPQLRRLKGQMERRDVPGVDEGRRRYPRPRRPLKLPFSLSRTPLRGRDAEYALLAERLREVSVGRGGAVAVEGEAGVGKTRLVEEFLGYARSRGALVLSGRCYERELGAPLEPIADAMEALETANGVVTAAGGESFGIIGLESAGSSQAPAPKGDIVYRTLARELIRRSRSEDLRVLVLFVDDVQWADTATLGFLSYLARRIRDERVLLVLAYRREDAPSLSEWLRRLAEGRATTIKLGRLSLDDLVGILERMSSRGFGGLGELAGFLHRESEGNPFYAIEYLRWLIESGIVSTDPRRRISALETEALQGGRLPSGVASLIKARIDGIGNETRNLLRLAAVVGRTFDLRLLSGAAAQGEAEVAASLGPAMAAGLVIETREDAYYFSHDKLRQTLYESLQGHRRRKLHLRVARALREMGGGPAELAHHYLRAAEWRLALKNLVLAAQRAEDAYAWESALESYARALEVLEKLPTQTEEKFGLLAARERLLEHMDRHGERAEAVRRMFELASRSGDKARLAEAQIRRIGTLSALGDSNGAAEAGQEAVAIFRELGDRAGEARAYREVGYVRWVGRDYAGALDASLKGLEIRREMGDRSGEAGAAGNIAQIYRGMGRHEEALAWAEESAQIHRELGDRVGEGMRLTTMASIHRERGNLETALSLNLKTLRYNEEAGVKNLNVAQNNTCGTLYLSLGQPRKALEHFLEAARLAKEIGYVRDEGNSLMSVGVALERIGDPTGAADSYRKAMKLLRTAYEESGVKDDLSAEAEASSMLATVLHRSLGLLEEAITSYQAAVAMYRKLGDDRRLCKVLLGLSGLHWRTGRLEDAAHVYEQTVRLARERGEKEYEAAALASLSVVYRNLRHLKKSVRCGKDALELLRGLEDPQAEAYVLGSLAEGYRELDRLPSALSCLKRSLRLRRRIGDAEGEIQALRYLAEIYEARGDAARARSTREEASRKEKPETEPHVERGG